MTWSYFIHVHGDVARPHSVAELAIQELNLFAREWCADAVVVLHEPFAVQGSDPLPVAQDARMLLSSYCSTISRRCRPHQVGSNERWRL